MKRTAALFVIISLLVLSACDLSTIMGGSTKLINNSDGVVTVTVNGQDFDIPAQSESQLISIGPELLTNGEFTISLNGIYYANTSRTYRFSEKVYLSPDCAWLEITNSTNTELNNLYVRGGSTISQPRTEKIFYAEIASFLPAGETIYIPLTDLNARTIVLTFTEGSVQATFSPEGGKTLYANITEQQGTFTLSEST